MTPADDTAPHHPLPHAPHLLPRPASGGEALVAHNAVVMGDVELGQGVGIWYGCVVRGDCARIAVGEFSNVQDLSMLHADTGIPNEIGAHVTIGHGAVVHGRRVGDLCLIGIGAIVLGRSEIGDGCIIAAGTVVKEGAIIPPRSLVAGVPGKVVRSVSEDEVRGLREHALYYWELAQGHRRPPAG